ncbi:hypothetical protein CQW23_22369 [Capsicum baccatum]|uniref:Uncharacterized protein n=1 Tax=Capsicum baccatum TaxID=33114 RepID=A0A2G2W0N9_CAPBA|nr:hypothetical protein CQW23_22369 [Capsicum baccatum]
MNEMDEAMQNSQIGSEDDQTTTNHDFGSTSMGCTQEFTQTSENLNTEMEDNELDDTNNEVNGNDPKDASTGCEMTIQHDELSKKEKRKIITKLCGTVLASCSDLLNFHLVLSLTFSLYLRHEANFIQKIIEEDINSWLQLD